MNGRRRWTAVAGACAAAILLVGSAGAFACDGVALLWLSPASGPAGTTVTATGSGYTVAGGWPVVLRWNSTTGPELARVTPDAAGTIRATFTVPPGPPGYYVVVGVQRDANGVDRFSTPTRASLQLVAAAGQPPGTTAPPRLTTTLPTATRPTTTTSTTAPPTTTVAPSTTTTFTTAVPAPRPAAAGPEPVAAVRTAPDEHLPAAPAALAVLLLAGAGGLVARTLRARR